MDKTVLSITPDKFKSHIQTERAVLGVILRNPASLTLSKIYIKTEAAFCDDRNRMVWLAMTELELSNIGIDMVTLSDHLRKAGRPLGVEFLIGLTETAPIGQNLSHYTKMVMKNYSERRVYDIFRAHLGMPEIKLQSIIDSLLNLAIETDTADHGFVESVDVANEIIRKMESGESLLEGHLPQCAFPKLNDLAPLCRKELLVISGVTSMGKTAFAVKLSTGLCTMGGRGIYLPFEGSFSSLVTRMFGQECGIPLDKIRKNQIRDRIDEIREWAACMGDHVAFNNNVGNVSSVINKIKLRKAMGERLDFVIIDHMHLMQLEKNSIREGFIDITKKLIQVAKDEDVLIIVLAQFRMLSAEEEGARPRGRYIRESATIQQDAHHIWLLYDPEFLKQKNRETSQAASSYEEEDARSPYPVGRIHREPAEIVVDKNREGVVGVVSASFDRSIGLWKEAESI